MSQFDMLLPHYVSRTSLRLLEVVSCIALLVCVCVLGHPSSHFTTAHPSQRGRHTDNNAAQSLSRDLNKRKKEKSKEFELGSPYGFVVSLVLIIALLIFI